MSPNQVSPKSGESKSGELDSDQQNSDQQESGHQNDEGIRSRQPADQQAGDEDRNATDETQSAEQEEKPAAKQADRPSPAQRPASNAWTPPSPAFLAKWLKWLLMAALVAFIAFYLITHPGELAKIWRFILQCLRSLLPGSRRQSAAHQPVQSVATAPPPRRQFGSFANPFSGGAAWPPETIVSHSFAALEAWAAERGVIREIDQTSLEFVNQLSRRAPALREHAQCSAKMLDELMFAGWQPKPGDVQPLAELWRYMKSN